MNATFIIINLLLIAGIAYFSFCIGRNSERQKHAKMLDKKERTITYLNNRITENNVSIRNLTEQLNILQPPKKANPHGRRTEHPAATAGAKPTTHAECSPK